MPLPETDPLPVPEVETVRVCVGCGGSTTAKVSRPVGAVTRARSGRAVAVGATVEATVGEGEAGTAVGVAVAVTLGEAEAPGAAVPAAVVAVGEAVGEVMA